jgi:hypothetical protein
MRRAARLDADEALEHQVVGMVSLEREVRRFLTDVGGPNTMALPPMSKEERRKVHELANAFHLKSISKGKGADRYTTLVKTTRSGIMIDERKIGRILRGREVYITGGKKGAPIRPPKHREGDVVGKVGSLGFSWLCIPNSCYITGSTKNRWLEHRLQDACGHGLG